MKDYRKYLQPQVIAQIQNIELRARLVVEGFITGLHKSPYHGFSVEFAEHRHYRPGDEIRYLDWKVYARSGKYYIKQFEEETNLRAVIALDASKSMDFASKGNIRKFDYGAYLAASLSFLMLKQRDACGLALYDTELRKYLPPNSKPSYVREILKTLETAAPSGSTGSASSLNALADRIKRRGLVIVISDFFDDPDSVLTALKRFRHSDHEVIAFHTLDPREIDFKFGSSANFVDMETGEEMITQPFQISRSYSRAVSEFIETIKKGCLNHNIDYFLIDTSMSFDRALIEYLTKRKKM
ncbi:MAG: DUF58 domain-containing protein [Chloroflexota bacterium]